MTTIRDHAVHCEAKKHAYRQTQDGVVISFVLHPSEIPDGLAIAPLGTRYMLAMVEIGDDEEPKPPAAKETAAKPQPTPNPNVPAGAKRSKSWHEMLPAQQAGILCSEPAFLRYLETEYPPEYNSINMMDGGADAGELVRLICGVSSRSELVPGSTPAETWKQIASGYRAWMEEPKVMG